MGETALMKLVVLESIIVGTVLLMALHVFEAAVGAPLLTACLGYVFGNGHGIIEAKRTIEAKADEVAAAAAGRRRATQLRTASEG